MAGLAAVSRNRLPGSRTVPPGQCPGQCIRVSGKPRVFLRRAGAGGRHAHSARRCARPGAVWRGSSRQRGVGANRCDGRSASEELATVRAKGHCATHVLATAARRSGRRHFVLATRPAHCMVIGNHSLCVHQTWRRGTLHAKAQESSVWRPGGHVACVVAAVVCVACVACVACGCGLLLVLLRHTHTHRATGGRECAPQGRTPPSPWPQLPIEPWICTPRTPRACKRAVLAPLNARFEPPRLGGCGSGSSFQKIIWRLAPVAHLGAKSGTWRHSAPLAPKGEVVLLNGA